ncbi:MAG: discoidin domain-containing protein [Hespellia sp.]|nr:discoidin domain-containing protein [Hespellia sp.]
MSRGKCYKMVSGVVLATMMCTLVTSAVPVTVHANPEGESEWQTLESQLSTYGGTWNTPEYKEAINDNIPQTALMGNGDVGVTSYGNEKEKSYLISKSNFISSGDLKTSAPFAANDLSARAIALGGMTIKEDGTVNKSLTQQPDVTVTASSVHDVFEPERAINGKISASEESWCSSLNGPHWLEIDLGKEQTIAKYVMYHMGKARPDLSRFNTNSYKVSVKTETSEWTVIDEVTGNTGDTTRCVLSEPVNARYVKIEFVQGEQASNDRARISEFELFSSASDKSIFETENKSLTQLPDVTVTASSVHDVFAAENVTNGKISAAEEGWVSAPGSAGQWVKIDLGSEKIFQKYIAYHIGKARTDLPHFNTRSYKVYAGNADSDDAYVEIDSVEENTGDITEKVFDQPISARYIKIVFNEGQQTGDIGAQRARLAEFELFQYPEDESIFSVNTENFSEHQDIAKADLTTDMLIGNVPVSMNTWLSATENTMITQIQSNGDASVDLDVSAWTKDDGSENYKTESGNQDNVVWSSRSTHNAAKENPESWTSKAVIATKVLGDKTVSPQKNSDASSSLKFTLNPQEKIYVVTTIGGGGQTYNNQDILQQTEPLEEAINLSNAYSGVDSVESLQQAHLEWWKNYWMKSYINIGDEDYHRYYYGSLYYMGCTSRADKVAPGLYGVWVTDDNAKYNNDYHLNYNYMAPSYGMYSSNRLDAPYAMTQPILDYMPKAVEAAKNNLSDIKPDYVATRPELADGIDGAVIYPVGLLPWGQVAWNATSAGKYINQTLDAPFAATLFISYYNYTQDEEFLLNRAYPFVEKVAKFYEKWCEKETNEDGTYQYNLYDGAHEGFFDKNSGVTIGAVQNVYEFLINNADVLKAKAGVTEEQYNMWVDMYENMSPIPVRTYTIGDFSKDVFALSEDGMILRPESASVELEFIHPGERLTFDSDPAQLEIARNTVEAKEAANSGVWGNMNNAPKMFTQAIRCGYDPAYVMAKFKETNINYMNENFTIRDGHHGIEKAGAIEFINNMLLQSSNGFVKVFPNWTGADAQFKTLREKGAYLVSSSMTNGKVDYVDIVSETGKDVKLVCPWEGASVTDEAGNPVEVTYSATTNSQEKVVEFAANEGQTYHVAEGTVLPDKDKLQELYDSVDHNKKESYTTQSWSEVELALENAKLVLDNTEAEEADITAAFEQLDNAVKALKLRADKTILQETVTQAEELNEEKYTSSSWEKLKAALEEAKKILNDETISNAEQERVNAAADALKEAITNLKERPAEPDKPNVPDDSTNTDEITSGNGGASGGASNAKGDKKTAVQTGDNSSVTPLLLLLALSGVMAVAGVRVKRNSRKKNK